MDAPITLSPAFCEFERKLAHLELGSIAYQLMNSSHGTRWSYEQTTQAVTLYKQFLYLVYLYPQVELVPNQLIDRVWHHHILDTSKYMQDCQMLFGRFIHHFPHFGRRSEDDRRKWQKAVEHTQALFKKHFGTMPTPAGLTVEATDCQPVFTGTSPNRPHVAL